MKTTACAQFMILGYFFFSGLSGCTGCNNKSRVDLTSPSEPSTIAAPSSLAYTPNNSLCYSGESITTLIPSVIGNNITYSVSPSLPTGVSLNTSTGTISGTPAATMANTIYTITATNSAGTTSSTVTLNVGPIFNVNGTSDESDSNPGDGLCNNGSNVCTLRAAVEEADALNNNAKIILPAGTISLTNGQILVTSNMKFFGATQATTIIDANLASRIFNVTAANVSFSKLTLNRGAAGNGTGGAINYDSLAGSLTLDDVAISNSTSATTTAYGGGGIFFRGLNLNLKNSLIKSNSMNSSGGSKIGGGGLCICALSNLVATITNVTFESNSTNWNGGGVNIVSDTNGGSGSGIVFSDVTFLSNTAGVSGGGIGISISSVNVQRSFFQGNTADWGGGGALYIQYPQSQTLTNSTFYANTTTSNGGAVYLGSGSVGSPSFTNNTFVNNSASSQGGGLYYYLVGGVKLKNNILSNNTGGNCRSPNFATFDSLGYNLDSANTCGFTNTGDLINTDPLLVAGAPAANGGLTKTIALQASSPARDAGSPTGFPATDQRGSVRPNGGRCDIGAYEY